MWFDYIKMLDRMGKDLHSPTLVAPRDLQATHDEYVAKVERQRIKEQKEADRKKPKPMKPSLRNSKANMSD